MKKLKRAACYVRVSPGLQEPKAKETEFKQRVFRGFDGPTSLSPTP
jgi:hypothetical protein